MTNKVHPLRLYLDNVLYDFITHSKPNAKILSIGFDNSINGDNERALYKEGIIYDVVEPECPEPSSFKGNKYIRKTIEEYSNTTSYKYDVILSIGVLGYYANWKDEQCNRFMLSIKKLLTPDGIFVLHMPLYRWKGCKMGWTEDSFPIDIYKDIVMSHFKIYEDVLKQYKTYVNSVKNKIIVNFLTTPKNYQTLNDIVYVDNNYERKRVDGVFKIFFLRSMKTH